MEWKTVTSTLGAVAAGALTGYLLDPQHGRRRRAIVRDKMVRAGRVTGDSLGVISRDLANRAQGLYAARRALFLRRRALRPERLEARVRSMLGRLVSHPRAISINATDGRLIISGYILEREVQPLLTALQTMPGVKEVENRLEIGRHPEMMPSLQGGRQRVGLIPDLFQRRSAPATRFLLGAGSAALLSYGIGRRGWAGSLLTALGIVAGVRAATNAPLRRLIGWGGREAVRLQKTIEVEAPVEEVFQFWQNFENFPRFMQHIRQVRHGARDVWHWEAEGPLGVTVSWDGVITRMEPNRRISWKSLPGAAIANAGTVWFEPTPHGTTRVHVQMVYNPPAGPLGHAVASFLGANPLRHMDNDLLRFKSLIEHGKTSVHGREVAYEELATQ